MKLHEAAARMIARNEGRTEPSETDKAHAQWAVAGILGEMERRRIEDEMDIIPPAATRREVGGHIHESGPTALGGPRKVMEEQARACGYTGDACPDCGNFKMVQNGTCKKCMECGSTTGCS